MQKVTNKSNDAIEKYIRGLIEMSFDGSLKGIVFDVNSLNHEFIISVLESHPNLHLVYHLFSEDEITAPYHPFLNCLKAYFKKYSEAEFLAILNELEVYALIKPLFLGYFYDDEIKRHQSVLRDEVYFEQLVIQETIIKLIKYMTKQTKLVFYLGHIHKAKYSTIKLLEQIFQGAKDLDMIIIGTLDLDRFINSEENLRYEGLVELLEEQEWLLNLDFSYKGLSNVVQSNVKSSVNPLKRIIDAYEFLAIEDCIEYGKKYYIEWSDMSTEALEQQFIQLLQLLGRAYYLIKEQESALFYDNMAYSIAFERENPYEICAINIAIGYDHSIRGDSQLAKNYGLKALNQAKEYKDEQLIYEALLLNFIISKDSGYNQIIIDLENRKELEEKAIAYGYDNHLSMIYTNPYELHDHFTGLKEEKFHKGIEIALKNGNDHQLGVAYHNQGIVYSRQGEMNKAFEYFKKSQSIKERIGDSKRVSYIYNSLGYYYFVTENYHLSHEEFMKSLNTSAASRDYSEVAMTFYNIALNAFLYGQYDQVCQYIKMLLKIMKTAGIYELKYHSKRNIYDIYCISLHKIGEGSKAHGLYNKLKIWNYRIIEGKLEEQFISKMTDFYFVREKELKVKYLDEALSFVPKEEQSVTHFRKFFQLERILYFKSIGMNSYKQYIKEAQLEWNNEYSTMSLKKLAYFSKHSTNNYDLLKAFPDITGHFERILGAAKIDQSMLKLRTRLNEINFLNIVQTMLINEESIDELLIKLQHLIHGNTTIEKSYCKVSIDLDVKVLNLLDSNAVIADEDASIILGVMEERKKPYLIFSDSTLLDEVQLLSGFSSIMYLPIMINQQIQVELLFMTIQETLKLNQEQLSIMTLIGRQIGEAIERIQKNEFLKAMNHKLKVLSITDLLTGLNNRNALENELQKEQQLINQGKVDNLIILFIDLDNFKVYNDTFGHNIGDQVLIEFGQILQSVITPDDFVARFGGDEFVVLLKNKTEEAAYEIANSIFQQLEKVAYFESTISKMLGRKVKIPQSSRLLCSIGLGNLQDIEDKDVDALLKKSDTALYAAKRSGKGKINK